MYILYLFETNNRSMKKRSILKLKSSKYKYSDQSGWP